MKQLPEIERWKNILKIDEMMLSTRSKLHIEYLTSDL